MKFKVENKISKDRYDMISRIRLFVWETMEYGVDSDDVWVEFNIDFSSIAAAKAYAAQYAKRVSIEEFTV